MAPFDLRQRFTGSGTWKRRLRDDQVGLTMVWDRHTTRIGNPRILFELRSTLIGHCNISGQIRSGIPHRSAYVMI